MARWSEIEAQAPELAADARARFDAHVHKTIATLRRDGAPRISGIELIFAEGDLWCGSMPRAVKALDLLRDPRFAVHSGSDDPPEWDGDAKASGTAQEVEDAEVKARVIGDKAPPGPNHLFRLDVTELSVVRLSEDRQHLIIESWHPNRGVERRERT